MLLSGCVGLAGYVLLTHPAIALSGVSIRSTIRIVQGSEEFDQHFPGCGVQATDLVEQDFFFIGQSRVV